MFLLLVEISISKELSTSDVSPVYPGVSTEQFFEDIRRTVEGVAPQSLCTNTSVQTSNIRLERENLIPESVGNKSKILHAAFLTALLRG